jgi:hypothetical protein
MEITELPLVCCLLLTMQRDCGLQTDSQDDDEYAGCLPAHRSFSGQAAGGSEMAMADGGRRRCMAWQCGTVRVAAIATRADKQNA